MVVVAKVCWAEGRGWGQQEGEGLGGGGMGEVKREEVLGPPAHLPGIMGISWAGQGEDAHSPESPRAPSPKLICRFQDVSRGGDCYFKKFPRRVWMLSPLVTTQLGQPEGHVQGGCQMASGALRLCLGWDSDGTGDSTVGVLLPGGGVFGPSLLPGGPRDF